MKKIIAVPTSNGLLDGHFGHCSHFTLVEVLENNIINEKLVQAPAHEPGLLPPWLAQMGVTDVIAGGMGQQAINIFNQHKVNVFVGAPKLDPKAIVVGFLNDELSFTANYCDH
jgi:predicted Fe-Mo cluster-binding NifX family protein